MSAATVPRRAVPPAPNTQALSSSTFNLPPLDGSLTFPELYDWHGVHNPKHRLFVFARGDGSVREILFPEAAHAIHVGAQIIANRMGTSVDTEDSTVIGIVAPSGKSFYRFDLADQVPYSCVDRRHGILYYASRHHACEPRRLPYFTAKLARGDCAPHSQGQHQTCPRRA